MSEPEESALEAYCAALDDGMPERVNFPSTVEDWERRAVTAVVKACGDYWHAKTVTPLQQEISDLRELLRISQENVKFLQMQMFTQVREPDAASEALRSSLAGETDESAIDVPQTE